MAFCTSCGSNIPNEINFCTECGKPMGVSGPPAPSVETSSQTPKAQPIPAPPPPSSQAGTQAVFQGEVAPPSGSCYAVMSVASYIGHSILFSLPAIGWIICLAMAFIPKNLNKRNFARAMLIFMIIGCVISIVLFFVFRLAAESILHWFQSATYGPLGNFDIMK